MIGLNTGLHFNNLQGPRNFSRKRGHLRFEQEFVAQARFWWGSRFDRSPFGEGPLNQLPDQNAKRIIFWQIPKMSACFRRKIRVTPTPDFKPAALHLHMAPLGTDGITAFRRNHGISQASFSHRCGTSGGPSLLSRHHDKPMAEPRSELLAPPSTDRRMSRVGGAESLVRVWVALHVAFVGRHETCPRCRRRPCTSSARGMARRPLGTTMLVPPGLLAATLPMGVHLRAQFGTTELRCPSSAAKLVSTELVRGRLTAFATRAARAHQ